MDRRLRPKVGSARRLSLRVKRRVSIGLLFGLGVFFADLNPAVRQVAALRQPDLAAAQDDPVLVGAGDIHAQCNNNGAEATASLLDGIAGTVFTIGDNTESGTTGEFESCYGPTWGRHKARTRPTPGNHDHRTVGAAPYFTYFGESAGPIGRGYYSYDLGAWHIIALDSEIPAGRSSEQYRWLEADLANHDTACTLAYWHRARYSSTQGVPGRRMKAVWKILDQAGVDVVLGAHFHNYERFAPQNDEGVADPNGIRQFVVGTGGKPLDAFDTVLPNSEVRYNGSFGVLKLTLHAASYSWEYIPEPGAIFSDAATAPCANGPMPKPD